MLDKFRETAITWDKANRKVYEPLRVSAGDNKGRKLSVQVVNGGVVENITGSSLSLFWETRDKAHRGLDVFTAVDTTKGEFEIYYTTGMLSNEGVLNANLVLVDTGGRVVSEPFTITVFKGIDDDAIQSSDSFTALAEALITVNQYNSRITNVENTKVDKSTFEQSTNDLTAQLQQTEKILTARMNDVIQSADLDPNKDAEVVDARHGEATLGSKVGLIDKQLESLGVSVTKLTNRIKNGDFESGTTNWFSSAGSVNVSGHAVVAGGKVSANAVKVDVPNSTHIQSVFDYDVSDVIYLSGWSKALNDITRTSLLFGTAQNQAFSDIVSSVDIKVGEWRRHSIRVVAPEEGFVFAFRSLRTVTTGNANAMFDGALAINLTKEFGQGNEPSKEVMDALLGKEPNAWFKVEESIIVTKEDGRNTYPTVLEYGAKNDGVTDFTNSVQEAVNVLGSNSTLIFPPGLYVKKTSQGIVLPSNFHIVLEDGASLWLDNTLTEDSTFFTNSDKVNGNVNITIVGGKIDCGWRGGSLDEFRTVFNFERVSSGKLDSWITNYNILECKRKESSIEFKNRWFEIPEDTPAFDCESVIGPGGVNTEGELSTDCVVGTHSLTVTGTDKSLLRFQSDQLVPSFLRDRPVSFSYWIKFSDVDKVKSFYPLNWATPGVTSGVEMRRLFESNKWYKMQSFTFFRPKPVGIVVGVENIDPLDPCQIWVDDIRIVRSPNEAAVSMSFDDSIENRFYSAPLLAKYSGRADWVISSNLAEATLDMDMLDLAYHQYGWNLISHTVTETRLGEATPEVVVQELLESKKWLEERGYDRGANSFTFPNHSTNGFSTRMARKIYRNVRHPIQTGIYQPHFFGDRPQVIREYGDGGSIVGAASGFLRRHIWVEFMTHVSYEAAGNIAEELYEWGLIVKTSKEVVDEYEREFPNISKYGEPKSVQQVSGYKLP